MNEFTESCFSIGNGRLGQRAFFEEQFSGASFRGSFVAGVHCRGSRGVATWKNGYAGFFDKMPNAPDWSCIEVLVDGEVLDLATCRVKEFRRELNMRAGILERSFVARLVSGREIQVRATRFCSIASQDIAAVRYTLCPLNFSGVISLTPGIDGEVLSKGANPGEHCWLELDRSIKRRSGLLLTLAQETPIQLCTGMRFAIFVNGEEFRGPSSPQQSGYYLGCRVRINARQKDELVIYKYVSAVTSQDQEKAKMAAHCRDSLKKAAKAGFDRLLADHAAAWAARWELADMVVEGNVADQQATRFNIFHLLQAHPGQDERLGVSPAGFTGQDFAGCASWETEAFLLPFYLSTAAPSAALHLLRYRLRQLPEAIEIARQAGFGEGAALYPAATLRGLECRQDWEIAAGTIHRNGAIAKAICDYVRYTGDAHFFLRGGLEILLRIARFWSQRVLWSEEEQCFHLIGVTGPNEYECNVNDNWYTNLVAGWSLRYAVVALRWVAAMESDALAEIVSRLHLDLSTEPDRWLEIAGKMFYPKDNRRGIYLQQAGFLQKEIRPVETLSAQELPLCRHWPWEAVLRSSFIQRPDLLQGLCFFQDYHFSKEEIQRNFDFYAPLTVHEAPASLCAHAILAARLGRKEEACDLFRRLAYADLENNLGNSEDGLHLVGMAGAWLAFVQGLGGMQTEDGLLSFDPFLPAGWEAYSFGLHWRGHQIRVQVGRQGVAVQNISSQKLTLKLRGELVEIPASTEVTR